MALYEYSGSRKVSLLCFHQCHRVDTIMWFLLFSATFILSFQPLMFQPSVHLLHCSKFLSKPKEHTELFRRINELWSDHVHKLNQDETGALILLIGKSQRHVRKPSGSINLLWWSILTGSPRVSL